MSFNYPCHEPKKKEVLPLYDKPRSRRTDPETSRIAEKKLKAKDGLRKQQLEVIKILNRHNIRNRENSKTASELGFITNKERYFFSRRLPELETMGYVVRGEKRLCSAKTGSWQHTWWLNEC